MTKQMTGEQKKAPTPAQAPKPILPSASPGARTLDTLIKSFVVDL